uniref:OTU domain-containing protein n=1 Tax=Amphimedon queenslandica TaxID=400682 RepID=A0A1X7UIF4_AMPQE
MSSLLMKSLPSQILGGDNRIMFITLVMKNFKEGAARILPGSPTTPLSDERVPNCTLDVPGDGNCLFYALSYVITRSMSQHYKLRKAIDRGLGREEAVIIQIWILFVVLALNKDYNVVFSSQAFTAGNYLLIQQYFCLIFEFLATEYVVMIINNGQSTYFTQGLQCGENEVRHGKRFKSPSKTFCYTLSDQWCFHNGGGASFQLHRFHIVIVLAIECIFFVAVLLLILLPPPLPLGMALGKLLFYRLSGRGPPSTEGGPPASGGRPPASSGGPPATGGGGGIGGGCGGIPASSGGGGGGPPAGGSGGGPRTTGGGGGG